MDNPQKLILPLHSKQNPEELYESLRDYVNSVTGFAITSRRIFKLEMEHDSNIKVGKTEVEVGKKLGERDGIVVAIFEMKDWYLVCTESRGAFVDSPFYIDGADVTHVIDFSR
jgi:hypothetical protein